MVITGWGYLNENENENEVNRLQIAKVKQVKSKKCQYKDLTPPITGNAYLCVRGKHNQSDTCKGDSGGTYRVFEGFKK